ncbi:D-alanine-D-alanine ligase [Syntrophus gentianae]|uniref:D-alanine--D-alanine ligase n=1 Tax=Syntrophus gentianae TaxID=43775 RepID=A0A1H7VD08_9BACT|nr:D-alanine--D-alanine ligase family protein [Syntrophus gentianae]SEM07161.1 D-alanine-D-alanine ligase [Syntrophus gentianae]
MEKKTVGLFFGGLSNEADISVISAKNIIKAFDYKKYNLVLVYWHKNNQFYILENAEEVNDLSGKKEIHVGDFSKLFDVALPITHGKYGEDGALQGLLEIQKVPYCGCRVLSSSLCMDKAVFKTFLAGHSIRQVKFDFIDLRDKKQSDVESWIEQIERNFELPVYIKPSNSGSSVGITKVTDFKNLKKAVREAARHDDKILAEQGLVNPREIEVAVLGNDELTISDPGELVLEGAFYDFDEKYTKNQTQVAIPADLEAQTREEIKKITEKVYHLCDCKGFARVDYLLADNEVYLNEINTLPGFTDISMFPMLMKSAGINYKDLITKIIKLAN